MSYKILKTITVNGIDFGLTTQLETRYFKNGKPNLHCLRTYHVEILDRELVAKGLPENNLQCFWLTSKAKALKIFNQLKKGAKHGN